MNEVIDVLDNYVEQVMHGKYTRKRAEQELDQIEKKYGREVFTSYKVVRKPEPWDKRYLEELEMLYMSGAISREFLSYMAEVSERVFCGEKRQITNSRVSVCAGTVVIIVIVILLIIIFSRR